MEKPTPLLDTRSSGALHGRRGFTLIELLITIAIAAILLTVAVPSFITFVLNNRVTSQTNDLVTSLNYAKSEAIKRGVRITVCSRATDTACAAATTWDTGWLVFLDTNGDGIVGGETVLQVRQPLENGNTLRTAAAIQRVTYRNSGFSNNGTFRLCDTRGTASARAIVVSLQGRVRTNTLAGEGLACP